MTFARSTKRRGRSGWTTSRVDNVPKRNESSELWLSYNCWWSNFNCSREKGLCAWKSLLNSYSVQTSNRRFIVLSSGCTRLKSRIVRLTISLVNFTNIKHTSKSVQFSFDSSTHHLCVRLQVNWRLSGVKSFINNQECKLTRQSCVRQFDLSGLIPNSWINWSEMHSWLSMKLRRSQITHYWPQYSIKSSQPRVAIEDLVQLDI